MRMIWMLGVLGTTIGCTPTQEESKVSSGLACANSSDCLTGELCVEQSCQAVDCATSMDCDLEEYCTANYECVSGCGNDDDCFAGDSCNTDSKECETYGCRDTVLDCQVGEFCNPMTAECFEDSRGHCTTYCSWDDLVYGTTGYECVNFDSGSGSCSTDINGNQSGCSGGAVCYPNNTEDSSFLFGGQTPGKCINFYRAYYCDANSSQEQCPNGFACTPLRYTDGSQTEPVCLGDCQYYTENGFIQ